jgi:hypothetical protein
MSPLKHAVVDASDGITLHWVWWSGNDKLKGPIQTQPPVYTTDENVRTLVVEAAHGSIVEGVLTWGSDPNTALVFTKPTPNTSATRISSAITNASNVGGFARLSVGNSRATRQQTWSTLDLGKAGASNEDIDSWLNNSHQGITSAAPEPTRGLPFKSGDAISWRLIYRQGLYEIYFAPASAGATDQTFYFGAAYGCDLKHVVNCVGGKKIDRVNLELHGAFAHSTDVKAWQTTLAIHDYNASC